MISISEFARLGQVSVRMLRHYDQVELLKPERVDSLTGHRSYVAAQLDRLHSIVALKDLGFTLEEVRRVLDKGLSPDELQGMLRLRQSDLEREHALAQRRLA